MEGVIETALRQRSAVSWAEGESGMGVLRVSLGILAATASGSGLDLPLVVEDSAGVERRNEVCSAGVPISPGGLKEPEGIALFDERGREELKAPPRRGTFCTLHLQGYDETTCRGGQYGTDVTRIMEARRARGQAPAAITDLTAEALGDGKARLTWSAPRGEPARFQLKWAEKQIVERVNWDRTKQACQFDPKTHASWWAANNVEGEPTPGAPGTTHSMVLEGLPPGRVWLAVRSFDAHANRSAMGWSWSRCCAPAMVRSPCRCAS
jgi:hypothetical protein